MAKVLFVVDMLNDFMDPQGPSVEMKQENYPLYKEENR